MKYRVLLMGRNNSVVDDFFKKMADSFESISTSNRYEDIVCHIRYFKPHLIVYCINNEVRKTLDRLTMIKYRYNLPFVIIGSEEACTEFHRIAVNVSDMTLVKPLTANMIKDRIVKFMEQRALGAEEGGSAKGEQPMPASGWASIPGRSPIVDSAPYPGQMPAAGPVSYSGQMPASAPVSSPGQISALDSFPGSGQSPYPGRILYSDPSPAPEPPRRRHILVVDDSVMMLKVIKEHLADQYDIATATSGRIALRFLERRRTDLILLDYAMPEEDGIAVLEKLRANDTTKDIPVIFLTGITEREKIQKALVLKPQGYLLKPVDKEKLTAAIRNVIG